MVMVCVQNLDRLRRGGLLFKWLELPATEEEIKATLEEIEVDGVKDKNYMIADADYIRLPESIDLYKLNEFIKKNRIFFRDYLKAREALEAGNLQAAGYFLLTQYNETSIVTDSHIIERIQAEIAGGDYMLIRNMIWDLDGEELAYEDAAGHFHRLNSRAVRNELEEVARKKVAEMEED